MNKRFIFLIAFVSIMIGFAFTPERAIGAEAGTYFVAVNGNDSWSGRLPKPKLTISD